MTTITAYKSTDGKLYETMTECVLHEQGQEITGLTNNSKVDDIINEIYSIFPPRSFSREEVISYLKRMKTGEVQNNEKNARDRANR